jgi:hypothetical protein
LEKQNKPTGIVSFKQLAPPPKTHRPFSNGTEADYFLDKNCHKCLKRSTAVKKCSMQEQIVNGFFTGEISTQTAQKIGILDPSYKGKCFEFLADPAKADVKPQKVDAMNQITMF